MILSYELSMPGSPSWNGKWSGEGRLYAKIINMGRAQSAEARAQKIIDEGPYSYHWSDGWSASVNVREVDAGEARKLRKHSVGFAGYDWMVGSIQHKGRIET